jgi:hypothetical protein
MILHSNATINFQKKLVPLLYAWLFAHIGIFLVKNIICKHPKLWMVNTICNQDRPSLLWTSLPSYKMFNMKNELSNKLDKKFVKYIVRNYKNYNWQL